ncbi:porin family protein [Prevotella sp.]|uniref:porin family protein n=1 Tax=Prevotella sp. TaxID=59823 RepID=UPI003AB28ACE
MKKLFTLIVLVAATYFAVPANAQLKFGIKGGLNITDMSLSKDVFETSNRTGFFIGPTIKFTLPIVGLGIDASALYDQREGEVNVTGDNNTIVSTKLKQKSINIPINLRYDIGLGSLAAVYLAAGPQFGFNVGDKNQSLYEDVVNWRLSSSNFSVNVGAGVMLLSHLQIGANYNIVCGKTGEITVLDGAKSVLRGRSNTWQISAAYYF